MDGEWSFIQTLRHLVFCDDKWFLVPVLGEPAFHAIGISNSGSADFPWPGVDREATATLDDVLAVRAARHRGWPCTSTRSPTRSWPGRSRCWRTARPRSPTACTSSPKSPSNTSATPCRDLDCLTTQS